MNPSAIAATERCARQTASRYSADMEIETLYTALAAASAAVASGAFFRLLSRHRDRQARQQLRRTRKLAELALARQDLTDEQKVRIKVLLAEAELYRVSGQSERAREAERKSARLIDSARVVGEKAS